MKCNDYSRIVHRRFHGHMGNSEKSREPLGWHFKLDDGDFHEIHNTDGLHEYVRGPYSFVDCISSPKNAKRLNVAWGLDFPAALLFRHFSKDQLRRMIITGTMNVSGAKVRYLPGKFISIRKRGTRIELYDISQFFPRMTMREALLKYVPIGGNIADLAGWLQGSLSSVGIHTNKLYSPANVAQRLMMHECEVPNMYRKKAKEYAYKTYSGGRIEVFKRGFIPHVQMWDIASAYPAEIRNLLDVQNGEWDFKRDYDPSAAYAFIRAEVLIDGETGLIPYRKPDGTLYYPSGKWHEAHITDKELHAIEDSGGTVNILDAWHFYPTLLNHPFRSLIDRLYSLRREIEKEDRNRANTIKLLMNSLSGKFLQLNTAWQIADWQEMEDFLECTDDIIGVKRIFTTGRMFNPVYAAIITANVRLKLRKSVVSERDLIAFHTDGLMTLSPPREDSVGDGMGTFRLKETGDAIVMGSGIYEIESDDGSRTTRTRSFNPDGKSLRDILASQGRSAKLKLPVVRPITLNELFNRDDFTPSAIAETVHEEMEISAGFDYKRRWFTFPRCSDFLDSCMESEVLRVK